VHLLASRLSAAELDRFADLAASRRVLAICRHVLSVSRAQFGTCLPDSLMRRLESASEAEPTAVYLRQDRRWHNELSSNLHSLPRWRDRIRLLREVFFPTPTYMQRSYGIAPGSFGTLLLPLFYFHRVLRGGLNVLSGRK
jgi:hypothetical protein